MTMYTNIPLIAISLLLVSRVICDIYMHNPRGSNNRAAESSWNRQNDKRLFDSQNNEKGGYNIGEGEMQYVKGSILSIEWTVQHSCADPNCHCTVILQYMCGTNISDGTVTTTVPFDDATNAQYGLHENFEFYTTCSKTKRNKHLFTADQSLSGDSAIYTRQNPTGNRYGFECPEERDYYPYWRPSPWIDIAVITSQPAEMCPRYLAESENILGRYYCRLPDGSNEGLTPITKESCSAVNGRWIQGPMHDSERPQCLAAAWMRDNHLGNGLTGFPAYYNWTIPRSINSNDHCILRIRYNISTDDYSQTQTAVANHPDISSIVGLDNAPQALKRGFIFENNPTVQLFPDMPDFKLKLAINTAQFGRTFEDRSHMFTVRDREVIISNDTTIYNLNVRGKRGNIVQVYPAVEYDFVPNSLHISNQVDYLHIQWTGSNSNNEHSEGEGTAGTDRSNLLRLTACPFNENITLNVNFPEELTTSDFMDLSLDDLKTLALSGGPNSTDGKLNEAPAYFDFGPQKMSSSGTKSQTNLLTYMSSRNNNFSNRNQKGILIVNDHLCKTETIGMEGGIFKLDDVITLQVKDLVNSHTYSYTLQRLSNDKIAQYTTYMERNKHYIRNYEIVEIIVTDENGVTVYPHVHHNGDYLENTAIGSIKIGDKESRSAVVFATFLTYNEVNCPSEKSGYMVKHGYTLTQVALPVDYLADGSSMAPLLAGCIIIKVNDDHFQFVVPTVIAGIVSAFCGVLLATAHTRMWLREPAVNSTAEPQREEPAIEIGMSNTTGSSVQALEQGEIIHPVS